MKQTLVFIHYLQRLDAMLIKIEVTSPKPKDVINARLIEDMFPLLQQAKIAIGFSLRACCPIASLAIASFETQEMTLCAVKQQLTDTIQFLKDIPEEYFIDYKHKKIESAAGFAELNIQGDEYYHLYALPNFMFHLNMVYAIARAQGVPLSKGDFDGYHQYPDKFSFT